MKVVYIFLKTATCDVLYIQKVLAKVAKVSRKNSDAVINRQKQKIKQKAAPLSIKEKMSFSLESLYKMSTRTDKGSRHLS